MVRDPVLAVPVPVPDKPSNWRTTAMTEPTCAICGGFFSHERKALGYSICMWCGEEEAEKARKSWTVAPMNKSNYMLITNPQELKQLNPKRNDSDFKQYINELGEATW